MSPQKKTNKIKQKTNLQNRTADVLREIKKTTVRNTKTKEQTNSTQKKPKTKNNKFRYHHNKKTQNVFQIKNNFNLNYTKDTKKKLKDRTTKPTNENQDKNGQNHT